MRGSPHRRGNPHRELRVGASGLDGQVEEIRQDRGRLPICDDEEARSLAPRACGAAEALDVARPLGDADLRRERRDRKQTQEREEES